MLHVTFRRIHNAAADEVRTTLGAMGARPDEIADALRQETSAEEACFLLPPSPDHVLVFASWLVDPEQAAQAFTASILPIDVELKDLIVKASPGRADADPIYRVAVDDGV